MRLGIIGCGNISETYFECQNLFNNFKVVACADINTDIAKKMLKSIMSKHVVLMIYYRVKILI